MQALEMLQLTKSTSPDEATLNSEEIKPVALAIIKLSLSEGISQSVSQQKILLHRKFLKFHINLVNLKAFLS